MNNEELKMNSEDYKKDIFGSFAYEFELLRFLVKSFACAHGEIIHFVNCEISQFVRCEIKFAHIRVSEYFTFASANIS